jgi:hypothetical protein
MPSPLHVAWATIAFAFIFSANISTANAQQKSLTAASREPWQMTSRHGSNALSGAPSGNGRRQSQAVRRFVCLRSTPPVG